MAAGKPTKKPAPAFAKPGKGGQMLKDLRELILSTRSQVAQAVNAGLTALYWQVGDRIRREILKESRAEYGAEVVATLGKQLEAEFGRGFSEKSLRHMLRFVEAFPDFEIVSAVMRLLSFRPFAHPPKKLAAGEGPINLHDSSKVKLPAVEKDGAHRIVKTDSTMEARVNRWWIFPARTTRPIKPMALAHARVPH